MSTLSDPHVVSFWLAYQSSLCACTLRCRPRYYQRGVSKTVTNIKIVAVDLLRKFGHINDDIRLNRLVTSCEKLFLNVALGDNQNTTSTPQQATKDPNWNEYMTAFQKGVESLFEHYHHLADEVDGGCKNVRALIKQVQQYESRCC